MSGERTTDIYRSAEGTALVRQRYGELLDLWPVPAERLQIPTREGETFFVATGPVDGPAVLVMQGSGANTSMRLPQIATLAADSRVCAVDVIGEQGLSAAEPQAWSTALAGFSMLTGQHFRHRFAAIPTFGDEALRGLTMPVLAIVGGHDPIVDSAGTSDRLEALVPSVDVRFLPPAGHLLPNPAEPVAAFLTGVTTAQHHG